MAHSWGSGPKMYKGSKHDSEWNNDLLWQTYVRSEAKLMRQNAVDTAQFAKPHDVPPHMRSVQQAVMKSEAGKNRLAAREKQMEKFKVKLPENFDELDIHKVLWRRTRRKSNDSDVLSRAGSEISKASSPRSARGKESVPVSPISSARSTLSQSKLRELESTLAAERKKREELEEQLRNFQGTVRRMEATETKMQAYDKIMTGLVDALKKSGTNRKRKQ